MRLTIVCTRYAEPDWLASDTLRSLGRQEGVEATVLFLDQRDGTALRELCAALDNERVRFRYIRIPPRGLSHARNQGVTAAADDIVLFIDSDAVAEPGWARNLGETLARDGVGIVGSRILARWHESPLLIARSRMVLGCYSMLDLGPDQVAVDRVVGAGFGIHRGRLGPDAAFDESLGRRPGLLLGGEETELCLRAHNRGLAIFYDGRALVHHQVLPERISLAWVMRRFYFAGFERALIAGRLPRSPRWSSGWDYLAYAVTLPATLLGFWRGRRARRARDAGTHST